MEQLVANVEHITFDVEVALTNQTGALALPFPGMDKSGSALGGLRVIRLLHFLPL